MQGYIHELGGKGKSNYFSRNHYITHDENYNKNVEDYMKKLNYTDVYYCLYSYESMVTDTCNIIGDFYLDFDANLDNDIELKHLTFQVLLTINYLKSYFKIKDDEYKLYFSGSKGFHIIVPYQVLGITPCVDLNVKYKNIAVKISQELNITAIDHKIYDRKRLFRMVNSINSKSCLYKVPMTVDMLYTITLDKLYEYAKTPKEIINNKEYKLNEKASKLFLNELNNSGNKKDKSIKDIGFKIPETEQELLPCTKKLLENGIGKGNRNNATVVLSSSLIQSGIKKDVAFEIVKGWNEMNEPPLDDEELKTTFESAYKMVLDGRIYGCASYKELDMCSTKCRVNGR